MGVRLFPGLFRRGLLYVLPVCVAVFWYWVYPHHVLYQDTYNLFLYTIGFWEKYSVKPGGWSEYAGLFLMQFFRYLWAGIVLNTLAFVWVYHSVSGIFRKWNICPEGFVWAWLPALGLLGLQMNFDFLFAETLKVGLFFAVLNGYAGLESTKREQLLPLLLSPFVLLLLGGGLYMLLYGVWAVGRLWNKGGKRDLTSVMITLGVAACVLGAWKWVYLLSPRQLYEFFPDASRVHVIFSARILFYGFVILVLAGKSFPCLRTERLRGKLLIGSISIALLAGALWGLKRHSYHPGVEDLLHAELAIACGNWKDMEKLAGECHYEIPTFIALTNLALAQEGKLADRMLDYPQTGIGGLVLPAGANYLSNLYGHEIYYRLGQNNEAFRYLFEAYNCRAGQVSEHVLRRMADLLIKLEKPEAAKKVLYQLKNSLSGREWAEMNLKQLIRFSPAAPSGKEDYYPGFAKPLADLMMMQRQDPENAMLGEYLLAGCLLEKQLAIFYHFFKMYYPADSGKRLPRMYEEALFAVQQTGIDPEVFQKYRISEGTRGKMKSYTYAYKSLRKNPAASRLLYSDYGNTYWYYMHFKK